MLPRVILHNVVSADGRMDWLAPDVGLYYELAARWNPDATLVGADTMLSGYRPEEGITDDAPEAFAPPAASPNDTRTLLVLPDSRGRIRFWYPLRRQPYWRNPVALVSTTTPEEYLAYLRARHVEYVVAGTGHVDYRLALEELHARHGVKTVRVDSGGTLNGVLLRAGLVDEVSLLVEPALVGGTSVQSMYRAPDLSSAKGVLQLRLIHLERMPNDIVWLRYEVQK